MTINNFDEFWSSIEKMESIIEEQKQFKGKMEQAAILFSHKSEAQDAPASRKERHKNVMASKKRKNGDGVEWFKNVEKLIRQTPKSVDQIYRNFEAEGLLDNRQEAKLKNMIRSTIARMMNEGKAKKIEDQAGPVKYLLEK